MAHEKFRYRTTEELMAETERLGISLPFAEDTKALAAPVSFAGRTLPNKSQLTEFDVLVIHE